MRKLLLPPRRLLFSGGGVRVISYLGALQVLQEKSMLHHVREFCGISAGGLVALLMALKYPFRVIERFCLEYDFNNVHGFDLETVFDSIEEFGLNSGDEIQSLIKKILHHKGFGPETTFGQLEASTKTHSLRVWASDIQYLKPIEFSAKETPNIPVVFGLYATMALPMYFTPILHPETQSLLVDGGLFDNYPISYLSDSEAEESIGFTFEYNKVPIDVTDIVSFCSLLFSGYYAPSYQKLIKKHECRTIVIPCKEISCAKFDINLEDRQKLVTIGRQATEDFFKTPFPVQSFRRNSVS